MQRKATHPVNYSKYDKNEVMKLLKDVLTPSERRPSHCRGRTSSEVQEAHEDTASERLTATTDKTSTSTSASVNQSINQSTGNT